MPLVSIEDLTVGFGSAPLLDGVSWNVEPGQKVGLLGRNGSGKTTLMRLLAGDIESDHGSVTFAPGARVARLEQDVPQDLTGSIFEIVEAGWQPDEHDHDETWRGAQQVERILFDMELDGERRFEALSAGMKRRVLLARALVSSPDLLLLDEPTNHLDVDAIVWLENWLARWRGTLLFVTHDRAFLRKLATRILEIDRGRLFDWSCDYDTFLERKEAALAAEEKQNALFDKKLAQEEVWIRTGIKARRTRNEGRVRALEAMRRERSDRREKVGKSNLVIQEANRSGTLVVEAKDVSFAYADRPIFENFSTTVIRGDKIGVLGPNGAGKTTLLRTLLGELRPQTGSVRLGTNLQIAYFDQLRGQLDEEATVQENVGEGSDTIMINGERKHVLGYLQDFLFAPQRARTPVKFLSGGERNRILLAKLFAKPANVIVLDEPTNDLDAETLEMLEERLVEFPGTVVVVSHDRAFLDDVVSSVIVFEPGGLREYVGGYTDWKRAVERREGDAKKNVEGGGKRESAKGETGKSVGSSAGSSSSAKAVNLTSSGRKLSFKEKQELQRLPAEIEKLEAQVGAIHLQMADPGFYQQPPAKLTEVQTKLSTLEQKVRKSYARWEELEAAEG
jgi:ATP-binding cassette subfamily F protein uup